MRSGLGLESVPQILPGVMAVSVLFGTTCMLAVTVTFGKKGAIGRMLTALAGAANVCAPTLASLGAAFPSSISDPDP